jgi:hypothetical protein
MSINKEKRKQLVREYKERKKKIGIFAIRNKATGKIFLDRTMNLDVAFNKHRFQLNMGSHPQKEMQADWVEFGEANFSYEPLETLDDAPDDPKEINKELDALMDLCLEKLAATPEVKGFY